eukprot:6040548-Prymnesium_polylepis.1
MEHYVRRMGRRNGRQVERCCILMDMAGFRPATLPHVYDCIEVLRKHYPGREHGTRIRANAHIPPVGLGRRRRTCVVMRRRVHLGRGGSCRRV